MKKNLQNTDNENELDDLEENNIESKLEEE